MPRPASTAVSMRSIRAASASGGMIVAEQMQDAVYNQMRKVAGQGLALLARFARKRVVREHHIAEKPGAVAPGIRVRLGNKRERVGRPVLSPVVPVEPMHRGIIGEQQAEFGLTRIQGG